MEKVKNKRNLWLDLYKVFLSILVIGIHCVGSDIPLYPVYRMAVPAFFMISGYFAFCKDYSKREKKAKGFIKSSLIYLGIGYAICIPLGAIRALINGVLDSYVIEAAMRVYNLSLGGILLENTTIGNDSGHLWFLGALLIVSLIHYILVKYKKTKLYAIVVPILLVAQLVLGGYIKLFLQINIDVIYTRNALLFGLPLFGLGYLLAQVNLHKKEWFKYIYLLLGIIFFFLQILENKLLGFSMECYFTSIVAAVFLLEFFISLDSPNAEWYYKFFGKNLSFYIYIIHYSIGLILAKYIVGVNQLINGIVVFITSVILYLIGFWSYKGIKKIIDNKKAKNEVL